MKNNFRLNNDPEMADQFIQALQNGQSLIELLYMEHCNIKNEANDLKLALEAKEEDFAKQETTITRLNEENKALKVENEDLKMKNSELAKMASKVTEKADHEDLIKGIRKYLNLSKNKRAEKKEFIKISLLELVSVLGIELPADVKETLDSFDDEEKATNVVIQGDNIGTIANNIHHEDLSLERQKALKQMELLMNCPD